MTTDHDLFHFDTDSIDLHVDACDTKVLTGFQSYFVLGKFVKEDLGSSATANGPSSMSGHGIAMR